MKQHAHGQNSKRGKAKPAAGSKIEPHIKDHPLSHIIADAIIGLLLTGILLVGKIAAEHTQVCKFMEESFYDLLQLRLSSKLDAETLKVIVVDIAGMRIDRHPRDPNYDFTDRTELLNLVQQIAEQQPRGIAVDIDFTPYANQRGQDRQFLDSCLSLYKPRSDSHMPAVPVYVGIHETVALGPDLCLGEPRFRDLAAFIGFAHSRENEGRKRIADQLQITYLDTFEHQRIWYCPSLSSAVTQTHITLPSRWVAWALKPLSVVEDTGYKSSEFLIDYSPLEAIEKNTVSFQNIDSYLRKNAFYDKYVFIGRGQLSRNTGDKFPIPGRRSDSHAGVYIHACAAYTLLRGALFELSGAGRLLLDVVLALFVIVGVALVRYHYRDRAGEVAYHRVFAFFTLLAVLLTVLIGFYMVDVTRLMWDDFVIVVVALLLHRSLEHKFDRIAQWAVRSVADAWNALLNQEDRTIRQRETR
jgi:CHASE2 domain-containing sensor protein